jgi:uncharacterized lipoprotein YajG
MKKLLILAAGLFVLNACDSTSKMTVTANPDPTTATSGTAGSAKFTDGPLHKPGDTLTTSTDTGRIKRENPPR